MTENWKKQAPAKGAAEQFGISTCIYPPQAPKQSLPGYSPDSLPDAPVAGEGAYVISPAVLPFGFSTSEEWKAVLDSFLGGENSKKERDENEKAQLEAMIQAIVEHSQEMLPLLLILREKAAGDKCLAGVVSILQDRLNLGINAACMLAPREMEVLELAAHGENNADIARRLNLQTVTVTKALSRAYRKLNAKNRTDAVHKWMLLRGFPTQS